MHHCSFRSAQPTSDLTLLALFCCRTLADSDYGTSNVVTVQPPVDLSTLDSIERFVAGLLWVELGNEVQALEDALGIKSPNPTCATCYCSAKDVLTDLGEAFGQFRDLFESFSMSGLEKVMKSLANAAKATGETLEACHIDEILEKAVVEAVLKAAEALVPGLGEVAEVVELTIKGVKMYPDVANAILSWTNEQYFASGVNVAKLINTAIAADLKDSPEAIAAATSVAASRPELAAEGTVRMSLLRNGTWAHCSEAVVLPRVCVPVHAH